MVQRRILSSLLYYDNIVYKVFLNRFTAVSSAFYKSGRIHLHFGRVDKLVVRRNKIHYFPCFLFLGLWKTAQSKEVTWEYQGKILNQAV